MRTLKERVIVITDNDKGYSDSIDFGGKKLYFDGGSRKHHYAHSVCEVVCSGIEGIEVGESVLVSYQAFGNFDDLNSVEISWYGRDRVGFVIGQEHVLGVVRDGDFEAFGDWVFLKSIKHEGDGSLLTLGMDTRIETNVKKGVGVYWSGGIDAVRGDEIYFDERFRSEYEFGYGNKFIVLPKDLLLWKGCR